MRTGLLSKIAQFQILHHKIKDAQVNCKAAPQENCPSVVYKHAKFCLDRTSMGEVISENAS